MADRETSGVQPQQAQPAESALDEQVLSVDSAALGAGGRSPGERRRQMLALQRSAGNTAVARLMEGVAPPAVHGQAPQATASQPGALLVAADAESVGPNQMRQDAFLDEVEQAACAAAEEALGGTMFTAEGCPWITHWIDYYRVRAPQQVEAAMHRYAPATATTETANECIAPICDRIRAGIADWRETGEIPPAPEDGPTIPATGPEAASDTSAPAAVARTERFGPGRPLDAPVRARMESAFSADFSDVEIHTDPAAGLVSRSLGARAVAIGSHVAFAPGQYEPGTPVGDALIAHELTHVVQQGEAPAAASERSGARSPEDEANLAALDVASARRPRVARRPGLTLQACIDPPPKDHERVGEEATEAIEQYDLEIVASRQPERGPTGMLATYSVKSNYNQPYIGSKGSGVHKLIGRPWFVFKPGKTDARPIYPKSLEELEVEFDEPGDWTIGARVRLPDRSFVRVSVTQHIDPLKQVAGEAFAQAGPADLVKQRAALELQAIEAGGGAVRDQNTGGDHIALEGSGQNPVSPKEPFGRNSYAFHRSRKAPADAPAARSYRWYAVPQNRSQFPSGYGGHTTTKFMNKLAFDLGGGPTASFHIELPDTYDIKCEALDADGRTITTAGYRQVVMSEKQAKAVQEIRTAVRKQAERIAKIRRGQEIGLTAMHTSAHSGRSTELALFAGPDADGTGYRLIDATPGVERSEYDGSTLAAAVKDFDDNNTYPEGMIVLEGPGVSRRNIATDGASDVREASSGFGWASLGLAALGVVALFTPAAVAAPYLFAASAVAGGTASALSIADELRNNEPNAIRIAVDVVGIAGSVVGLGQAGRMISQGSKVVALSRGAQYLMYTGFGTDVLQGVLMTVDAADQIEAIQKQLKAGKITREQATDQIVRLLAMLAMTGGLMAYGARDLRGAKSRVGHAIDNATTMRSLQADALHHLDALDDKAITGLKGLRADELDNIAKVIGTNHEGAKRLSKAYGAEFVERARSGRFQTLESLAEDLGEAAGRRAAPDAPTGAGGKPGGHEAEPSAKPVKTEQGDIDVMGRPDDAIALEHQMGPNAHGEPHVFHMTEGGLIFRCSDFCQDILANIEERTRRVREHSARTQRALDLERNWRREGSEITSSARRLRDSARKMARDHQRRLNTIAKARAETRRQKLETSREAWLTESRESLMTRAESLERRMAALEDAVGLHPTAPAAAPRQPQTVKGLQDRYPDILDSDPGLKKELQDIEKAKADPAQAVDAERRLLALEQQLIKSVEAGLPEAIARARQMQVAAGEGLVTVTVNGRPMNKCRAQAGGVQTVSGANAVDGYAQQTREVIDHGHAIGHTFAADNFDETVAKVINKGRDEADRVATAGTARASHAEKQAALAAPGHPIGVSLPMCFDCYEFFRLHAIARGRPVVVADPDMVRVFYPDGRVLAPSRTGANPLGGAQPQ
jgi:Domain of unknown function (DUF4157)